MLKVLSLAVLIAINLACTVSPSGGTGGGAAGGSGGSAGGGTGGGTGGSAGGGSGGGTGGSAGSGGGATSGGDAGVAGVEFLSALAGLWSGPATMTRLGVFPQMNFDFRPVDGQFVFGQSELDSANTLRFGFSIETHQGRDVVAYRNGGYFMGVLRDSRTVMVEADAGSWRFCSVTDAGCNYIDARFSVSGAQLSLNTQVKNATHLVWNAQRVETRTLPSGFPTDLASRGDGSAPWPVNATVKVDASWTNTLAGPADVWVLLTTTPCFPSFGCKVSRSIFTSVLAGAQSAALSLPNVHPGAYKVTVLLDPDRNFAALRTPNTGDRIAIDLDLTVPATGTVTLPAVTSFSVP